MAVDLVIDIENTPVALAWVVAAISDAGVNIAAATCFGPGERAQRHILVAHAEAAKHALAISHVAVTREREVVVVDVEGRPGVLADLTRPRRSQPRSRLCRDTESRGLRGGRPRCSPSRARPRELAAVALPYRVRCKRGHAAGVGPRSGTNCGRPRLRSARLLSVWQAAAHRP